MSKEELTKEQYMRMHADDSIKRMAKKLDEYIKLERNTLTVEEFAEFAPLYNKEKLAELSQQDQQELAMKFGNRVSMFDPLRIVDKKGPNGKVIALKLPVFNRIETVNNIKNGTQIVNAFFNANERDSVMNIPYRKKYSDFLSQAINITNTDEQAKQRNMEFEKERQELLGPSANKNKKEQDSSIDIDSSFEIL